MPQSRRGRIAGTENYSKEDLTALLDEIARVLPTGANEWDMVLENYLIYAERTHRAVRDITSIKKKFQALLNCPKPTGDASCPDYVRRARRIQLAIEESVLHDGNIDDGNNSEDGNSAEAGGRAPTDDASQNNDEATPASANSAPQSQASTEETAAAFALSLTPTSPPADRHAASRPPPRDAGVSAVSAREGQAHRLQNQILSSSDEFPMLRLLNHAPSEQYAVRDTYTDDASSNIRQHRETPAIQRNGYSSWDADENRERGYLQNQGEGAEQDSGDQLTQQQQEYYHGCEREDPPPVSATSTSTRPDDSSRAGYSRTASRGNKQSTNSSTHQSRRNDLLDGQPRPRSRTSYTQSPATQVSTSIQRGAPSRQAGSSTSTGHASRKRGSVARQDSDQSTKRRPPPASNSGTKTKGSRHTKTSGNKRPKTMADAVMGELDDLARARAKSAAEKLLLIQLDTVKETAVTERKNAERLENEIRRLKDKYTSLKDKLEVEREKNRNLEHQCTRLHSELTAARSMARESWNGDDYHWGH